MAIIYTLCGVLLFSFLLSKSIKKKAICYYVITTIIGILTIILNSRNILFELPDFLRVNVLFLFFNATIASAFFIIVMYLGALPKKLVIVKKMMPIRGELSIIASILTLSHNIVHGKTYFVALFKKPLFPVPLNYQLATIVSILMLIIMIPLFITSFKTIRKKMKPKSWKKLQKLAYIFYGLMWLHIFCLYYPQAFAGGFHQTLKLVAYTVIFSIYLILKLRRNHR